MTFFSVVIPTYNRASSLPSVIESVLCQTFPDFEILVIDDGSTDDTRAVVDSLIEKDSRITYHYQQNKERGAARNLGISKSRGLWISFLDSDDFFLPHHLEYLKQSIAKTSSSIIASRFTFQSDSLCHSATPTSIPSGSVSFSSLLTGNPFACNFSIRNNVSDILPFPEDRRLATMEDWLFLVMNHSTHGLFLLDQASVLMTDHTGRSMYNHQQVISARLHAIKYLRTNFHGSSHFLHQLIYGSFFFCSIHSHLSADRTTAFLFFIRSLRLDIPLRSKLTHFARILCGASAVKALRKYLSYPSLATSTNTTSSPPIALNQHSAQSLLNHISVRCYSLYDSLAASHRVRIAQYQQPLSLYGITLDIQSLLSSNYLKRAFDAQLPSVREITRCYLSRLYSIFFSGPSDLALIYCELFPFLPAWIEKFFLPKKYIYDLDDAFFLKYRHNRPSIFEYFLGDKIDKLISQASCVTAGNEYLYNYCSRLNDHVFLLPSSVDLERYSPRPYCDPSTSSRPFTIGWIGTPSTVEYLLPILPVIQTLSSDHKVRLLVVGAKLPSTPACYVVEQDWSYSEEINLIHQFDVGIMPLPSTSWARGKCAYKLIQCMACAVPVIASPVGANQVLVDPSSGFLASSSAEWLKALHFLIRNPLQRRQMGHHARNIIRASYSLEACHPTFVQAIHTALAST